MANEHEHQAMLIKWFDLRYMCHRGRLFAIPNGGQRHVLVASKLKAEGVRRGVPDLMLPIPMNGYHGLFIEMKKEKGRTTEEQESWLEYLNEQGYLAIVCRGFDEAKIMIINYLELLK